jgi:hypothetical protein
MQVAVSGATFLPLIDRDRQEKEPENAPNER